MGKSSITVTDQRTGETRDIAIEHGAIHSDELYKFKAPGETRGLWCYDPGLKRTAPSTSQITCIDGEQGDYWYRGYSVAELAERASYLETAYLLIRGELPDVDSLQMWQKNVNQHRMIHESLKNFLEGFRYDAPPLGMLVSSIAAFATIFPDSSNVTSFENRRLQIRRIIGKIPTLAAFIYRRINGLPFVYPRNDLDYVGNFFSMVFAENEHYQPNPTLVKALNTMFVVLADHGYNCSATMVRNAASAHADPYTAISAAAGALSGNRHVGANDASIRQILTLETEADIEKLLERVRTGQAKLAGYGHRVYRKRDPRTTLVRAVANQVFEVSGNRKLLKMARALEQAASADPYIEMRGLHPNVDFYSGLALYGMGFPVNMIPLLLTIPRVAGWLAHWTEVIKDPSLPIVRPRAIYVGPPPRPFVSILHRKAVRSETAVEAPGIGG